jgi:hypothetical protein
VGVRQLPWTNSWPPVLAGKEAIPGLPSWVADWTELPETLLGGFARAAVRYQAGHADFNRDNYSVQSRLLYVHNTAVFDTISAMTYEIDHDNREVSDWYSSSPHWFQQLCSIVQEQLSALEEDELDHDGFQRRDYRRCPGRWRGAICRTLLADANSYWGLVPGD